ncbi:MAG TPA: Uma2 family endonuclease [Thermoanaerobaculia bacterium]|nr:Uma2 family endonuclease [Thermoanaerobaculia bacterium]
MTTRAAVILDEEDLRIPAEVYTLAGFRRWSQGDEFPERGRIDYLDGEVEVDLSPEDLYTHSVVKSEIATGLHTLVKKTGRGNVFIDRTRIVSPAAELSVEPDVVVLFWESLQSGRVREIPSAGKGEGRYIELEGAPDLIVEVVSDSSVRKDLKRLPAFYARAGVPELWTVDARGESLRFEIRHLGPSGYEVQAADDEGWIVSPVLHHRFRLRRSRGMLGRYTYELDQAAGPA